MPMRIIAGRWRGRQLLAPTGQTTRPITDRVKQSTFDILTPLISGATVYDCFAGTGSAGLECLSRGAIEAVFFESDRSAAGLLRQNIERLGAEGTTVITADVFRWFQKSAAGIRRADLIFLDPPYRFLTQKPGELVQLAATLAGRHMSDESMMLFRHDAKDSLALPALRLVESRAYGSMIVDFLKRPASAIRPAPGE